MRTLFLATMCSFVMLLPSLGRAEDNHAPVKVPGGELYRGHFLDLSAVQDRNDTAAMESALRHQVDLVEDVAGLSPHVLEFFRTIPVSVNEVACLNASKDKDGKDVPGVGALLHDACFAPSRPNNASIVSHGSLWDAKTMRWTNNDRLALAEDTDLGVILVRPYTLGPSSGDAKRPVILHELLHAYHKLVMPDGYTNSGIRRLYDLAKAGQFYPADEYLMTNEKEFFAVTGSVFLYGSDGALTRQKIKEKQPDYYRYLVLLFGFDPDRGATPLASATKDLQGAEPQKVSTASN
jgi:hypothetical protein